MKTHILAFLLAFPTLINLSCKDDDPIADTDLITSEDIQLSSAVLKVEHFVNECEFIARSFKTSYPNQPGVLIGATIVSGLTDEGKTKYDITFNNVTGPDNKKRNGKLTVVFENVVENGVDVVGKHLHVRSDDETKLYTVEGIKFKGSLIFSNISNRDNSTNNVVNHLNAQSFLYTPQGEEIRFSSTRKSKWTNGSSTTQIDDDSFEITEQQYSLALIKDGTKFAEAKTASPLTLYYQCLQSLFTPSKGIMEVEHVGGKVRQLSFGNGNCNEGPVIIPKN